MLPHFSCLCHLFFYLFHSPTFKWGWGGNENLCGSFKVSNSLDPFTLFLCSLFIFPQAGPDIKYLLGFVRTQLSTTTTILLVFGPKILRVLRGQGDKWDHRSRARGITASFCTNGGGLMPEDGVDVYQENEELKVRKTKEFVRQKSSCAAISGRYFVKLCREGYFKIGLAL